MSNYFITFQGKLADKNANITYTLTTSAKTLIENLFAAQIVLDLPVPQLDAIVGHVLTLSELEPLSTSSPTVIEQYANLQAALDRTLAAYKADFVAAKLANAARQSDVMTNYLNGLANIAEDARS